LEAFLSQNFERPLLVRPDGEVRRPIAADRSASDILDAESGDTDIVSELGWRLSRDALVGVTMARHLVPERQDPANHAGMTSRYLAEHEERAAGPMSVEQHQQVIDAAFDP